MGIEDIPEMQVMPSITSENERFVRAFVVIQNGERTFLYADRDTGHTNVFQAFLDEVHRKHNAPLDGFV